MTPNAFQAGMTILHEIYPRKELSEAAGAMYLDACRDLSDDLWFAAVKEVCATGTFFPVPAELLRAADRIAAAAHGVVSAEEAWEHVHTVARSWREGSLVKSRFDALAWNALAAIGGIRTVALAEDGYDIDRKRRQFMDAYERRAKPAVNDLRAMPLPQPAAMLSGGDS